MDLAEAAGKTYEPSGKEGALRQGEILSDVHRMQAVIDGVTTFPPEEGIAVDWLVEPWAVVLSQDCDLDWDFAARAAGAKTSGKLLPHVLLGAATPEATFRTLLPSGSDIWKRVVQSKDERYLVLREVPSALDLHGVGLPRLGLDFKRYFAVDTELLYLQFRTVAKRRTRLREIYASHLSARFYAFQARVPLPVEHHWSPPGA